MQEQPEYKSLKVTFATWQAITRLSAQTGEPRTRLIERLVNAEADKLKSDLNTQLNTNTADKDDTGRDIRH